jgi:predicted molibdopterin-dependent oxidoreductase YjgC
MASEPLFRSLDPDGDRRTLIEFEGRPLSVLEGVSLATALLEAGIDNNRATPVSGAPRAPYCMMGVCFDCLVRIDGVSQRACRFPVHAGLQVSRHVPGSLEGEPND